MWLGVSPHLQAMYMGHLKGVPQPDPALRTGIIFQVYTLLLYHPWISMNLGYDLMIFSPPTGAQVIVHAA